MKKKKKKGDEVDKFNATHHLFLVGTQAGFEVAVYQWTIELRVSFTFVRIILSNDDPW